jgi:phosphoketolase
MRYSLRINRKAANCNEVKDKLMEHEQYIDKFGEDLPEIRNWKWSNPK